MAASMAAGIATKMVTWVIAINALIALAFWLVAWQLLRLRRSLQQIHGLLGRIEQETRQSLLQSQLSLINGQQELRRLGLHYRQAGQRLRQVKQLLLLLSWLQGYVVATKDKHAGNRMSKE